MKIKKELVEQREAFVTNFFKTTPTGNVKDLNSQLANLFGKKMALSRIYQIRKNTVGTVDCRATNPMMTKGIITQAVEDILSVDQKSPSVEVHTLEEKSLDNEDSLLD